MRVVVLDPGIAERLGTDDRAETWRAALHAGGWFVEPGPLGEPEGASLREVRLHLAELETAELNLRLAHHPMGWLTGTVPRPVVVAMVLSFVALVVVGQYATDYGGLLLGLGVAPVLWGAFALVGLLLAIRQELTRREFLALSRAQRARHALELHDVVQRLTHRTFVLRTDGGWVVSAPHHAWLTDRLRDLRLAHTPDAPPERRELMERLRGALEPMDAAIRTAAHGGPPPPVEVFRADVAELLRAFVASGVPRGAPGAALARVVERHAAGPG